MLSLSCVTIRYIHRRRHLPISFLKYSLNTKKNLSIWRIVYFSSVKTIYLVFWLTHECSRSSLTMKTKSCHVQIYRCKYICRSHMRRPVIFMRVNTRTAVGGYLETFYDPSSYISSSQWQEMVDLFAHHEQFSSNQHRRVFF